MEEAIIQLLELIKGGSTVYADYRDCLTLIKEFRLTDKKALKYSAELRLWIMKIMPKVEDTDTWFDLYKDALLFEAPDLFDSYLLYLEIGRKPSERFYQPRRKILKRAVDAMQALVDDELAVKAEM